MFRAHRVAFFLTFGQPIPDLLICHSCDNPGCCNPRHLWQGTAADNNADRSRKGRTKRQLGEEHGLTTLTNAMVTQILLSDATQVALAGQFGVSCTSIKNIHCGRTWANVAPDTARRTVGRLPSHTCRGEKCHTAKLKASDIPLIRSSKETNCHLAAQFNVSDVAISYARNGKTWKHVVQGTP
jgi:hypothetical protein